MHRLQEYFEDSRFEDGHSGASSSFPPPPSGPSSPAATVVSHNPFPYQGTSFSAPSSPSSRSTSLHNVYSDPRSKTYVRYSLDPVSEGESSSSPHRLADRHVRGQVVRKSIKAHKGAGKGKISPPDAGLDNGSAGVGSVLLSMGRGPQDSRKAVVVGNDGESIALQLSPRTKDREAEAFFNLPWKCCESSSSPTQQTCLHSRRRRTGSP